MADGVFPMVVSLPSVSGLPEDSVNNVLNVALDGVLGPGDLDTAMAAIRDFYLTLAAGQGTEIGAYISDSISRSANACSITAYATLDLSGATPLGSPVDQLTFTLPAAIAGTPLPEEVATVLSYAADLTDVPVTEANPTPPPLVIRPQQRRRGRMYIGPLQTPAGAEISNQYRPSFNYRTDAVLAFEKMALAVDAVAVLYLGVWSKADAEVWEAITVYMDDAWDTQRRRGLAATTRTTESW